MTFSSNIAGARGPGAGLPVSTVVPRAPEVELSEALIEAACGTHGGLRHLYVHEAGHAVSALDFGVEFRAVVRYDETSMPAYFGGTAYAPAAVEMLDADQTTWVAPNPVGSLRFVASGAAAEQALLGHFLPDGHKEDMFQWRRGSGCKDAQTFESLDEYLGESFKGVMRDVQEWARANEARIAALADRLSTLPKGTEMSYAEVLAFIDAL